MEEVVADRPSESSDPLETGAGWEGQVGGYQVMLADNLAARVLRDVLLAGRTQRIIFLELANELLPAWLRPTGELIRSSDGGSPLSANSTHETQ